MLLNFHPRFVPMILDGSKSHTIRAARAREPKVGEICHCYTGLRHKGAKLLGRWPCVKVEWVEMYECGDGRFSVILTNGAPYGPGSYHHELGQDEKNMFAWVDGFRTKQSGPALIGPPKLDGCFDTMILYWIENHWKGKRPFEFTGNLIHWRQGKAV
jgi:hypothetical protein